MAARLNKRQADTARSHIKVNRILEELTKHMAGEREMTSTQVRAAEILLNKSLPSLSSVEQSFDTDAPIKIEIG